MKKVRGIHQPRLLVRGKDSLSDPMRNRKVKPLLMSNAGVSHGPVPQKTLPMADQTLTVEFLGRLRAFIRRRLSSDSDADDVLQDVLLKLVEKGRQVSDQSVPAWLFTVARRAVIDRWRVMRPLGESSAEIESVLVENDQTVISDLADCMEPLLLRLDDGDRSILRRVDMEGVSQAEIAREFGVAISTIKSRVQRARARLQERLLACCTIEHDVRGTPIDYQPLPNGGCGAESCSCQPAKVQLERREPE